MYWKGAHRIVSPRHTTKGDFRNGWRRIDLTGKVRNTLDYIIKGIKYICVHYKNRSAGSASEENCQEHFKSELSKWADLVETETFTFHPKAFMGWLPIAGVLNIISVGMFWIRLETKSVITPVIALVTVIASVLLYVMEFLLYREFIDFLFPKAVSRNIMARRAPKGEVRRRIIFGGHADAAIRNDILAPRQEQGAVLGYHRRSDRHGAHSCFQLGAVAAGLFFQQRYRRRILEKYWEALRSFLFPFLSPWCFFYQLEDGG